jgi:glycosyltransferase involved in cell wall biosynthesis
MTSVGIRRVQEFRIRVAAMRYNTKDSRNHSENSTGAKVTIGVCVKNSAKTIREAIESIIQQNYPRELLEVIFVDDGSEDSTLSIINHYVAKMDFDAKIFHHKWMGLGPSRNVVVDNASGRYIIWVDGDMILPRDHVQKQVEFIEQNPKVGIAKARYGIFEEGSLIGFLENMSYVALDTMYGGRTTYRTLGSGGSIYRVDAIRQAGGFDPEIRGVGEDLDAESRVRQAGWCLYLGTPAIFYEQRRKSLLTLWDKYFWYGHGNYDVYLRHRRKFSLFRMNPIAGFVNGALLTPNVYSLTGRKSTFLLPLHSALKATAWCLGFAKSQITQYKSIFSVNHPRSCKDGGHS